MFERGPRYLGSRAPPPGEHWTLLRGIHWTLDLIGMVLYALKVYVIRPEVYITYYILSPIHLRLCVFGLWEGNRTTHRKPAPTQEKDAKCISHYLADAFL